MPPTDILYIFVFFLWCSLALHIFFQRLFAPSDVVRIFNPAFAAVYAHNSYAHVAWLENMGKCYVLFLVSSYLELVVKNIYWYC